MSDDPSPLGLAPRSFFGQHRRAVALGVLLGLPLPVGAGLFLFNLDRIAQEQTAEEFRPIQVGVAVRDLPAGKLLSQEDLDFRTIPWARFTPTLVLWAWRPMAVGQRLLGDVPRGEFLRWTDFDPSVGAPSRALGEGQLGANVDASSLKDVKPGEHVRVSARDRYNAIERLLVEDARVVAVDGTTAQEPGPDEKADEIWVALLEIAPSRVGEVLLAESRGEIVLSRVAPPVAP